MKRSRYGNITRATLLFEIKGNSLDDGPGIRTVVFFKGCPLDCVWCHNPESKGTHPEISYDPNTCIGCGRCRKVCPEKAVSRENPFYLDRSRCTLCGACIRECPSGALARVGFEKDVEEVVRIVLRDKPFFDNSGGGVTLSGGEPTLHLEYAADLSRRLKSEGINVLLETCGLFPYPRIREHLLPYLDTVYFDLKLFDDTAHRRFCGVSNILILENFTRLAQDASRMGIALLPRIPLVPGITDTDQNLLSLAGFLKEYGMPKVDLLPYNPLWHDKCRSIGVDPGISGSQGLTGFMENDRVEHCRDIFRAAGITGVNG